MSQVQKSNPAQKALADRHDALCDKFQENFKKGRKYLVSLNEKGIMTEPYKELTEKTFNDISWRISETVNSVRPYDNTELVAEILKLRLEYAKNEGAASYSQLRFNQSETLFNKPSEVSDFLMAFMKKCYEGLKKEREEIQQSFPQYRNISVIPSAERNSYLKEKYGNLRRDFSYDRVLTSVVELLNHLYGIECVQNAPLLWTLSKGDKKAQLKIDLFNYSNAVPGAHYANCTLKDENGIKKYEVLAASSNKTRKTLSIEEVRFFLMSLGNIVFDLLYQGNDKKEVPVEIKSGCRRFLGQFAHDAKLIESFGADANEAKLLAESVLAGLNTEYFVEALKALIDVEVHIVSDEKIYDDLKVLENSIIRRVYDTLRDERLFPEYLDSDILSLTNMSNVFAKGRGAYAYLNLAGEKVAEYLYSEYEKNPSFIQQIESLWAKPEKGNALYDKLASVDFYLK